MNKIALIVHSGYGHTFHIAQEIAQGIKQVADVSVDILTTQDASEKLDTLAQYDAFVFGTPTYMGGPSTGFKAFADATSSLWFNQVLKDKLAAGFTNSGSLAGDKLATLQYLSVFAAQHSMIWISLGILAPQTKSGHGATPEDLNRTGTFLGLATQSDTATVATTPAPGDIKTARLFGQRIAEITKRWTQK